MDHTATPGPSSIIHYCRVRGRYGHTGHTPDRYGVQKLINKQYSIRNKTHGENGPQEENFMENPFLFVSGSSGLWGAEFQAELEL